jgi:hypothetical protein
MGNPGMPANFMLPPPGPGSQPGLATPPASRANDRSSVQQMNHQVGQPASIAAASVPELPPPGKTQPAAADSSKASSDGKPPQRRTLMSLFGSDKSDK